MDWFEFKLRHIKFLCILVVVTLVNMVDGKKLYGCPVNGFQCFLLDFIKL